MTGIPESYVTSVLELIAEALIETGNARSNLTDNTGGEFTNDVFEMRSYVWDDESPDASLPNFYFTEFDYYVTWYKYLGRGDESNKSLSFGDAIYMLQRCLTSLHYYEGPGFEQEPLQWDIDPDGPEDDEY